MSNEYSSPTRKIGQHSSLTKKIIKVLFFFQGFVGRRTSFEVKVNGKLVHSKLSTMAFPDFHEVVSIVQVWDFIFEMCQNFYVFSYHADQYD